MAKVTSVKEQETKKPIVAEKHVSTLEVELKEAEETSKQVLVTVGKSERQTFDAFAPLATSLQCITEV